MAELIQYIARKVAECCFWLVCAIMAVYLAAKMRGLSLDDPQVEDAKWATQVSVLIVWSVLSALKPIAEDE